MRIAHCISRHPLSLSAMAETRAGFDPRSRGIEAEAQPRALIKRLFEPAADATQLSPSRSIVMDDTLLGDPGKLRKRLNCQTNCQKYLKFWTDFFHVSRAA